MTRGYRTFRFSRAYDWYARIARPKYAAVLTNDRKFYRNLFRNHAVGSVFDVGANVGDKSRVFRELCPKLVCVEADPDLADVLRYRFRGRSGIVVEPIAIGEFADGTAILRRKHWDGFNTLSDKWAEHCSAQGVADRDTVRVCCTNLDTFLARYGEPDYIKIDVEGYEIQVLRGLSSAVQVVSFEANIPIFREEKLHAIDRLVELDPRYRFNARTADAPAFMLPELARPDEIADLIGRDETATYDVFALAPASK